MDKVLEGILEQLHNQTGRKHDIYYKEGKGALIVPEGYPLKREFVIFNIDESFLHMMSGSPNFRINFG